MTKEELMQRVASRQYTPKYLPVAALLPTGYIHDRTKSVIENEEYVIQENKKRMEPRIQNQNAKEQMRQQFIRDLTQMCMDSYGMIQTQAGLTATTALDGSTTYGNAIQAAHDLGRYWQQMEALNPLNP